MSMFAVLVRAPQFLPASFFAQNLTAIMLVVQLSEEATAQAISKLDSSLSAIFVERKVRVGQEPQQKRQQQQPAPAAPPQKKPKRQGKGQGKKKKAQQPAERQRTKAARSDSRHARTLQSATRSRP